MANTRVAADAGEGFARCGDGFHVVHDVLVTFAAGILRDAPAAFFHLNWFVKLARRKRKRMEKPMVRFGKVLRNEPSRGVAIVAGGSGAMAGFDPAIEVILHDMAIGAGPRIVAQVGSTF